MAKRKSKRRKKPSKPYPSFPLTAHNNGQWCKKIRGKIHFFGVWDNPQTALDNYLRVAADLHEGRQPRQSILSPDSITVKDVCNRFLTYQQKKAETGDISQRWFEDCRRVLENFAHFVGASRIITNLAPDDFLKYRQELTLKGLADRKGLGVHALDRAITAVRGMFKHAYEVDLIDKPIKYGKAFNKPSASLKRKARQATRQENGNRMFKAQEIRTMLETAKIPLRTMILLGVNGGFGNTDCARLPVTAVDFDRAVIDFDRPKTAIERTVPLWPETLASLQETLAKRPTPAGAEAEKLVFLTIFGHPWVRDNVHRTTDNGIKKVVPVDAIGQEFDKIVRHLDMKRNPFKFGMIGSSDTHTSMSATREGNYFGKLPHLEPSAKRFEEVVVRNAKDNSPVTYSWQMSASGLAAAWAKENTRESIFDAMARKEVYATTGSRILVRVFAGWDFKADEVERQDFAKQGYARGVPMGGDLSKAPRGRSPSFMIRALRDPDNANLDRVQVIKGWVDKKGKTHERIYDVAVSDGRKIGKNGRCKTPVVSTVNVADASYTNTIGDPLLTAYWKDPDFDAKQRAFYYVRVIEIPKPRWTAYDAKFFKIKMPKKVKMTVQDRVYTSPIWYTP